jgi:adenylate kinase
VHLDAAIELTANTDDSRLERLSKRAAGRTDDTPDVIRRRLEVYSESTAPLIALYADSLGTRLLSMGWAMWKMSPLGL